MNPVLMALSLQTKSCCHPYLVTEVMVQYFEASRALSKALADSEDLAKLR